MNTRARAGGIGRDCNGAPKYRKSENYMIRRILSERPAKTEEGGVLRGGPRRGHTFAANAAGGDGDVAILWHRTCAAWRARLGCVGLGRIGCCHREVNDGFGIARAMMETRVGGSSRSDHSRPRVCWLFFLENSSLALDGVSGLIDGRGSRMSMG
jgi:hypothetical protein